MPPTDSDRPDGDGPDGSSIKPVSSLLARFENINKPAEASQPQPPPPRAISPAPKPDRLRDFKPLQDSATPAATSKTPGIPPKPKDLSRSATVPPKTEQFEPPVPHPLRRPSPNPRTQTGPPDPPSVTVQPPQSPPKGRVATLNFGDRSAFLNPDHAASPTTPGGSPKQFKIPSRPMTPTPSIPPPRSPKLASSQPPSPPPPRRSAELRREREARQQPTPLTPREKPLIPAHKPTAVSDVNDKASSQKAEINQETSPFNSPPGSPGGSEDETPPELPRRPRPQTTESYPEPRPRPKSTLGGFEPPPVHHSIASRRTERDPGLNGAIKGPVHPQLADDQHQAQFTRTQSIEALPQYRNAADPAAPPRPPRPGASTTLQNAKAQQSVIPPKRIPSGPTAQLLPPPTRAHGRSKTVDSFPAQAQMPMNGAASEPKAVGPSKIDSGSHVAVFPDGSNTNRRPPFIKKGCYEILTKYDPRIFDVCGDYVCTSGQLTRVWSLLDGELLMSLAHTEGVKATSVAFKPAAHPQDEGSMLWIGTNMGEIMEVEVATQSILCSKGGVHGRYEVTRIYRHYNELWTLDEAGNLHVWSSSQDVVPNLDKPPAQSFKVPKAQTFSMVVGSELWHATGKELRVFAPTPDARTQFQVLMRPLVAEGAGEVTSGTLIQAHLGKVFLGHADGKVSIWSSKDYSCNTVLSISGWKISSLVGTGNNIWAAYNTGKICVYDMGQTPWVIKKEWQAHENPIVKMVLDPASAYRLDRLQVVSLGADNKVRAWDGLLQDDWLEDDLKSKDTQYCEFEEIRALVLTWNAGASTPHALRYSGSDAQFFPELLQSSESPDILVFSFQELVDLEDKTATAKRLLKGKKKEGVDTERMSHQYRDWRDFLVKTLDDYMPEEHLYHLLQSAPLVGLFTCIFVKASLRDRIRNLSAAEVKRGMGGVYGNKGAVAIRFQIEDSSLCFVNCHLAAGQTQATARHNDIAAILEANLFPAERDLEARTDSYAGGGDGTMVLDHELCILNGDLNYRIDTMSRDTVVTALKNQNLTKLLDRDQLLVARRRNPAFRLRAFDELPITFAPTYKYDVGSTNYDTSEKRRSPAWCDRLLYKGRGRIQQVDYRRHEVFVSDHRPVTGKFRLWVKKIDPRGRAKAWMESQQAFEDVRQQELAGEKLYYLRNICGFDDTTSKQLAEEKISRRSQRSPSRTREGY